MAKKYNKHKEKLGKKAIIILVCTVLIIAGVFIFTNIPGDKEKIASSYDNLTSTSHSFKSISFSDLKEKIDAGDKLVVYYGKTDCDACQDRIDDIQTLADTLVLKTIYYLNDAKLNDTERKELSVSYGIRKNFTPQVLAYEGGNKLAGTYDIMFGKSYTEDKDTLEFFKNAVSIVLNA